MVLPNPPNNVPQIVDVQSPTSGHYVVNVKMPTNLAAKWPDKPWLTSIKDIGLSSKDAAPYPDYVLVDVEPMKGTPDLIWVFQKLSGPIWTTTTKTRDNLIPQKYREQVVTTKTEQEVVPSTLPADLTGDIVLNVVDQTPNTGKALQTIITDVIAEDATPLVGQIAYVEREVADTAEALVVEGTPAEEGLLISSSKVDPLGNGKSIKMDITVPSWTEHHGSDWDPELMAQLPYTEQFVAIEEYNTSLDNTKFTPINKDRLLKTVQFVPIEALDDYLAVAPTRINLQLPRVLESADIVWNESTDIGTQDFNFSKAAYGDTYSLGTTYADQASSSASIQADLRLVYKDYGNIVAGKQYSFYLPNPVTEDAILAKVGGAEYWPVFKTKSHAITISGQSISVSVNASCGFHSTRSDGALRETGMETGTSEKFGVNLSSNTVQIPPCLNGLITFSQSERTLDVSAVADVSMFHSDLGNIAAVHTKTGTAYGRVSPASIPATSVEDIPRSGLYVADSAVRNYRWGYSFVTVSVFDAIQFE